jgi:hypothetical protein
VLLLFGAVSNNQDVYQWLVPDITYHVGFFDAEIIPSSSESTCTPLLFPVEYSSTEKNIYSFDGYLAYNETSVPYPIQILATAVHPDTSAEVPVFIRIQKESGVIFISTIHEYPTATFVAQITHGRSDTPF